MRLNPVTRQCVRRTSLVPKIAPKLEALVSGSQRVWVGSPVLQGAVRAFGRQAMQELFKGARILSTEDFRVEAQTPSIELQAEILQQYIDTAKPSRLVQLVVFVTATEAASVLRPVASW